MGSPFWFKGKLDVKDPHPLDWHFGDESPAGQMRLSTSEWWFVKLAEKYLLPAIEEIIDRALQKHISSMSQQTVTTVTAIKLCPVCGKNPLSGRQTACSDKCRQERSRRNRGLIE